MGSGFVSIAFFIIIFSFSVGIDYFQLFEIGFEVTTYILKKPEKVSQTDLKFGGSMRAPKWSTEPPMRNGGLVSRGRVPTRVCLTCTVNERLVNGNVND